MSRSKKNPLAGIEYVGIPGVTQECKDAVMRLLQFRDQITRVRILTCSTEHTNDHCLLLTVNGDLVAVKSGFGSGYRGEGPHGFSYVLQLLKAHGAEIEEYEVDEDVIARLDSSSLTESDIKKLDASRQVRPRRWFDYVFEEDWERIRNGTIWHEFLPVVPFGLIDSRIVDLAISFWEDPDNRLLTGYRRLEDIVRGRTGIDEHGAKLFQQAFIEDAAKLGWKGLDRGEQKGRGQLFTAAYMAHRNPRAHRERNEYSGDQLSEFLLLNHLYLLEKESREDWGSQNAEQQSGGSA